MGLPAKVLNNELLETRNRDYKIVDELYSDYQRIKMMKRLNTLLLSSFILFLTVWSLIGTKFSITSIFSGLGNMTSFIFVDLLPPDFSVIGKYLKPALDTIYMSYVGMCFAVLLSLVLGVLAAKTTTPHSFIAFLARTFTSFLRSIPALVWGILLVSAIGLGPFAGTIAIALSGVGILGKAYAEILEEIDMGQIEAVRVTGASWLQVIGQAVWPQFKAGFAAWSLYKLDLNIREAAVLGVVGAGGIGYTLQGSLKLFQYKEVSTGIVIIFFLILMVEYTTAKIRERVL